MWEDAGGLMVCEVERVCRGSSAEIVSHFEIATFKDGSRSSALLVQDRSEAT